MGIIKKIDTVNNTIHFLSEGGGGLHEIVLDNIPALQIMPEVGQRILTVSYGDFWHKLIRVFGNDDSKLCKGDYALDPGEAQYQGVGGSYLRLNVLGDATLVDGNMLGSIKLDNAGREISVEQLNILLTTFNGINISINQAGSITISNPVQNQTITMDSNGIALANTATNSTITLNGDGIVMKAKNISLDGDVFLGPGASDPTSRQAFGDAVNSGPYGSFPLDFSTGIPIPGSSSVRINPNGQ